MAEIRKETIEKWFSEASALEDKGRLKEAFRLYLKAAMAGDDSSQLNVGVYYSNGQGVARSPKLAMYWTRRALRGDSPGTAANNIGTIYRDAGKLKLAVQWFEKAVALGEDGAMLDLAKLYLGPLKDPTKGKRLLAKVAVSENVSIATQEYAQEMLQKLTAKPARRRRK